MRSGRGKAVRLEMKKGTSSDSAVISFLRLGDGGMVGDGGMTATSLVMHYYRYAAVVGTFG